MSSITCTNCSAENSSTQKYCNRCGFALPAPKAEAPALAPAEVEMDPNMVKQWEDELKKAENCPIEDLDEDI